VSELLRTAAVVLRRVDYGEADRVVTLLTESHGKVTVIARGARRSKQRFGSALEPFGLSQVGLSLGRGSSLASLREASPLRAFPALLGRLASMRAAGAAIERTRELLPDRSAEPEIFHAHVELFESLTATADEDALGLAFLLRTLALLGLPLRLTDCARCGKPRGSRPGTFTASMGGVVCQSCGGGPLLLSHDLLSAMTRALGPDWASVGFGPDRDDAQVAVDQFVEWHLRSGRGLPRGS
jgi:DNA repair protein RecO (recombination protein O)